MKKRKQLTLLVKISVPVAMPASVARREVRANINEHSCWGMMTEEDDVKALSVRPAPRGAALS